MSEKFYWLIGAGHSGVAAGHYFTAGKRSPGKRTPMDPGVYEGKINREIAERLCRDVDNAIFINPGPINVTLRSRIGFVNQFSSLENCALLSLHCNAARGGWGPANGSVIFHSRLASKASKRLATLADHYLAAADTGIVSRGIKAANHAMTTLTRCPALTVEMGFMTHKIEAEKLADIQTQIRIVAALTRTMRAYEEEL